MTEYIAGISWSHSTDFLESDGALLQRESGVSVPFKQVRVTARCSGAMTLHERIKAELKKKEAKGFNYARDISLIIFRDNEVV